MQSELQGLVGIAPAVFSHGRSKDQFKALALTRLGLILVRQQQSPPWYLALSDHDAGEVGRPRLHPEERDVGAVIMHGDGGGVLHVDEDRAAR